MLKQLSWQLVGNYIEDFLRIRFQKDPVLKPLVIAYYISFRCNFNCSYCNFAKQGLTKSFKGELNTEACTGKKGRRLDEPLA